SRMNSFWQTWRKEIIRGVVLFCGVIAIGLCIRYVVVRARQGVMDNLPVALRGLRGLRDLKNLPNNFDFDPDAYGDPATPRTRGRIKRRSFRNTGCGSGTPSAR